MYAESRVILVKNDFIKIGFYTYTDIHKHE